MQYFYLWKTRSIEGKLEFLDPENYELWSVMGKEIYSSSYRWWYYVHFSRLIFIETGIYVVQLFVWAAAWSLATTMVCSYRKVMVEGAPIVLCRRGWRQNAVNGIIRVAKKASHASVRCMLHCFEAGNVLILSEQLLVREAVSPSAGTAGGYLYLFTSHSRSSWWILRRFRFCITLVGLYTFMILLTELCSMLHWHFRPCRYHLFCRRCRCEQVVISHVLKKNWPKFLPSKAIWYLSK